MRALKWNKDKNIRDAGHWLASKIELIELKDKILKNNQKVNIKKFHLDMVKKRILFTMGF